MYYRANEKYHALTVKNNDLSARELLTHHRPTSHGYHLRTPYAGSKDTIHGKIYDLKNEPAGISDDKITEEMSFEYEMMSKAFESSRNYIESGMRKGGEMATSAISKAAEVTTNAAAKIGQTAMNAAPHVEKHATEIGKSMMTSLKSNIDEYKEVGSKIISGVASTVGKLTSKDEVVDKITKGEEEKETKEPVENKVSDEVNERLKRAFAWEKEGEKLLEVLYDDPENTGALNKLNKINNEIYTTYERIRKIQKENNIEIDRSLYEKKLRGRNAGLYYIAKKNYRIK